MKDKKALYKKWWLYLLGVVMIAIMIAIPFIINMSYKYGLTIENPIITMWGAEDVLNFYGTLLGAISTIIAVVATILYTTKSEINRRNYDLTKQEQEKKIKKFEEKILSLVEHINPRLFMGFNSYSKYDAPISFKDSISHFNIFRYHLSTVKLYLEITEVDKIITDYLQDLINEDTKILKALEDRECVVKKLNYLYITDKPNKKKINALVKELKAYDIFFNGLYETDYNIIINNTRDLIAHYKKKNYGGKLNGLLKSTPKHK
ncbi:MAG: hypothetical protein RR710_08115 [Oscillospiraceae bacterium]